MNGTLTKHQLVKKVSTDTGLTFRDTLKVVNSALNCLVKGISEKGHAEFRGFGSFNVATRKARRGRNPKTGQGVNIPEKKTIRFRPGTLMKGLVK